MSSGPTIRSQEEAMSSVSGAAGHAALAICESMLLSLTENKVIDETEARAILEDAAAAHRNAIPLLADGAAHDEAATLIEAILKGGNSVRHA
jgi:hypothetical protein